MQGKFENPRMKHSEITDQLGYSSSTLKRYINDINMLSPYRLYSNTTIKRSKNVSNTNIDNKSHREQGHKRAQINKNETKMTSNETTENNRNKIKGGDPSDNQ